MVAFMHTYTMNADIAIDLVIHRQMCHDPSTYADPFTVKPERFLAEGGDSPELDPRTLTFGFGRR